MRESLRAVATALYRPRRAFRDWSPRLAGAAGLVFLLCVLNVAAVFQAASAVGRATTGESLSVEAHVAANAYGLPAFVAPLVVWLAASALIYVALGGQAVDDPDDRVRYSRALTVTAIGLVPGALRYAVRPFVVSASVSDGLDPRSIASAHAVAQDAMLPDSAVWTAVVALTAAWSAYVWWGCWQSGLGASSERAAAVAVVVAAAIGLTAFAPVVDLWRALFGLALVLVSLPAVAFSRKLERLDLWFDLIGTRGGENVEIRPWRVAIRQVVGLFGVLTGAVVAGVLLVG